MTVPVPPEGRFRQLRGNGRIAWELQCPECWCWGKIGVEQLHGRVSTDHSGVQAIGRPGSPAEGRACTFHEFRDWVSTAERI